LQAEEGIRDDLVTGVQTCALPICDFDGTHVILNSAKGRIKDKNMRRNPNVAISIQDPENPYRYLGFRGKVVEVTENGADAHIDSLSKKYTGQDKYTNRQPGEVREMY